MHLASVTAACAPQGRTFSLHSQLRDSFVGIECMLVCGVIPPLPQCRACFGVMLILVGATCFGRMPGWGRNSFGGMPAPVGVLGWDRYAEECWGGACSAKNLDGEC